MAQDGLGLILIPASPVSVSSLLTAPLSWEGELDEESFPILSTLISLLLTSKIKIHTTVLVLQFSSPLGRVYTLRFWFEF